MNRAVIIVTHEGNKHWLDNLLRSIPIDEFLTYNVRVFRNGKPSEYELGAIHWAIDQGYDEFVLLQDTVEIKDVKIFELLFNTPGSVSLGNKYFMYMGKYERKHLLDMHIPHVNTKLGSVTEETSGNGFCHRYFVQSNATVFDLNFRDTQVFTEMFGDRCMVLENDFIRKYKRVWDLPMIKEEN